MGPNREGHYHGTQWSDRNPYGQAGGYGESYEGNNDGAFNDEDRYSRPRDNPVSYLEEYRRESIYSASASRSSGRGRRRRAGGNDDDASTVGNSTVNTGDANGAVDVVGDDDEISRLYCICEGAIPRHDERGGGSGSERRAELDRTWEAARGWLAAHPSASERRAASMFLGDFSATVLHLLVKVADPPADIVESIVECSPEVVSWRDSSGWLPLHHACANGASLEVISMLCDTYPDGKVTQDRRQRTPLHFAFFGADGRDPDDADDSGGSAGNSMAEIVRILGDTGAARLPDEGGMLPMHYACAYGTSTAVLEVLEAAFPESVTTREHKGRTPLHLAMVNAHRRASPAVLRFLLSRGAKRGIADATDSDGHLALNLLAIASRLRPEQAEERKSSSRCLRIYLDSQPKATADFLSALQALPEWLRDTAVLTGHVQNVLNRKMIRRAPALFLLADGYMLLTIIVSFTVSSQQHIDHHFAGRDFPPKWRVPVFLQFIGGAWLLLHEIIQVVAMVNLGTFRSWLLDGWNWLDCAVIVLVFYYGAMMATGNIGVSNEVFRIGLAGTQIVLWFAFISFLKSLRVEFAVTVRGVGFVLASLLPFLVCLVFILLAFATMFNFVYTGTPLCNDTFREALELSDTQCYEDFPHCEFDSSLLKVYTMMLGEVGEECRYQVVTVDTTSAGVKLRDEDYANWRSSSIVAQFLFVLYALIVVIVLSNMLIAIVTDSYGVIKNERAAMVFWSNRLDFVAEIDAIANLSRTVAKKVLGAGGGPSRSHSDNVRENPGGIHAADAAVGGPTGTGIDGEDQENQLFRRWWSTTVSLLDPNLLAEMEVSYGSMEFWFYLCFRIAAVVAIPVWLLVGLLTCGLLWPPQVREWLLMQKPGGAFMSRADVAEQAHHEIDQLKKGIKTLRREFKREMKNDLNELIDMKARVETVRRDVLSDMSQVQEIVSTLTEFAREKVREREERGIAVVRYH